MQASEILSGILQLLTVIARNGARMALRWVASIWKYGVIDVYAPILDCQTFTLVSLRFP